MRWGTEEAWREATALVAAVYGVRVEHVRQPTRGRGARPPKEAWGPRKLALFLTMAVAGNGPASRYSCRELGMHRDTIRTACADIRQRIDDDDAFDALVTEFERVLGARLNLTVAEADLVERHARTAA